MASSRQFSSAPANTTGSVGKTEAEGLGGMFGDLTGANTYFRAGRGDFTGEDRRRIDADRVLQLQSRREGGDFTSYLRDAAQGRTGPSVAQQQLAQSTGQAEQAVSARAASARGPNRALAMRDALGAQSQLRGEANAQAATLRAQEQMSREQMVAEQLRQQRMLDLQAQGLSQDEAIAKLQAEMQAQQINAQIAQGNAERAERGAGAIFSAIGSMASMSDIRNKRDITPLEPLPQSAPPAAQEQGGGVDAGMVMSMLSDERAKKLEGENSTLRAALRAAVGQGALAANDNAGVDLRQAPGFEYRYKDPEAPGAAPGRQVGPMAQDLERTSARGAVVDTPRGKMVDAGRLALTTAAATGQEQRRGDAQDQRIAGLENALRDALRATRGGSFGDEPMELGFDEQSGIFRAIGSVPGETNEERLERELREALARRKANPFNVPAARYDLDALDAASRRGGIEPIAGGMR